MFQPAAVAFKLVQQLWKVLSLERFVLQSSAPHMALPLIASFLPCLLRVMSALDVSCKGQLQRKEHGRVSGKGGHAAVFTRIIPGRM